MIVINNGNNNAQNNEQNNNDEINYIKATECRYKETLNEADLKSYEQYFNKGCCGSGSNKMAFTLLIYSIIIVIFNVAGLFFLISKNSEYKSYKEKLELALKSVETSLPDISEMQKLLTFEKLLKEFKINNTNNYYDHIYRENCSYDYMRIGLCSWSDYKSYYRYYYNYEFDYNYMDYYASYENERFLCTYNNYYNGLCSRQQYLDYESGYLEGFLYYGGKPKRIDLEVYNNYEYEDDYSYITVKNIKGISFYRFWCDIGKYDSLIMMSLLIVMVAFIILLIVDLCIKKDNISNGILYYVIVLLYMIFYIVNRIFICLLFCLMIYSVVVLSTEPVPEYVYPLYTGYNYEDDIPYDVWGEKRAYAVVFAGIVFFLFIFVCMLDGLSKVIINYLGLNFEENQRKNEISRNVSINLGEEVYEMEVKNTQNIYLDEVRTRKKIKFKEIKFDKLGKENCYIKLYNKGLIDQLGFSEWDYPNINEGFSRLGGILNLIYVVLFFSVILTKFHVKDEYAYNFLKYAIELGISIKLSKYYNNYGSLEKTITDYRLYVYIIISIIILLLMLKRAFFGGFKYSWIFWIFFIISILFVLLNLGILLLTILVDVYSWFSLVVFTSKLHFEDEELLIAKFCIQGSINVLLFIFELAIFIKSISYTAFILSINREINSISYKNEYSYNTNMENREEGFEFTALDTKPYYFQAININNLPKFLFYLKSNDKRRRIFIAENQNIFQKNQPATIRIDTNYVRTSERENFNNEPSQSNNNRISNLDYNIEIRNNIPNNNSNNIININNNANDSREFIELKRENERLMKDNDNIRQKIRLIKEEINKMLRPQ